MHALTAVHVKVNARLEQSANRVINVLLMPAPASAAELAQQSAPQKQSSKTN